MNFHDGVMAAGEAVHTGWSSLRNVFRMWHITSQEEFRKVKDLLVLCRDNTSARTDARVALLEVAFVGAVLHVGRQSAVPRIGREGQRPHHARTSRNTEEMVR